MTSRNIVSISYSGSNASISQKFHPNYSFNAYNLYWNTGSGYATTSCLNANGNHSFNNNDPYDDFYIGNGRPDEAGLASGTLASALVGVNIGMVRRPSRTQTSNIATIALGSAITDCARSAQVNNASWGEIANVNGANYSWNGSSSYSWVYIHNGYSLNTPADYTMSAYIRARAKNNSVAIGVWYNGSKVSSFAPDTVISYPDGSREDKTGFVVVFGLPFNIAYYANGGSGSMSQQSKYYGVSEYEPQGAVSANAFSAPSGNYVFDGWNTAADGTGVSIAEDADVDSVFEDTGASANGTVTLYAQWRYVGFSVTVSKSVSGIGSLSLVRVSDGEVVASESNGTISHEGSTGDSYRVECALSTSKPDVLYTATGIASLTDNTFTPSQGDTLSYTFALTAKPLYFVADKTQQGAGGTLEVMNPAEPDGTVTVGQETLDAYAEGRNVTVTAVPDSEEQTLVRADLYDGSETFINSFGPSSITNGSFVINNLTANRYVKGVFDTRTYPVSLSADVASADAVSAVSVTAGGSAVTAVVKDTSVTFSATIASGFSFEGFYEDGEKVADTVTVDGQTASFTRQVASAADIVVKAKASVSLDVTGGEAVLEVNGEPYTPQTEFFVTLGESFTYALTVTESGKYFNGWFDKPYDPETSVPKTGYGDTRTVTPTEALDIIAVVGSIDPTAPVYATFAYANGSDATQGSFSVDGVEGPQTVELAYTGSVAPKVALKGLVRNGYLFAGWFSNPYAQGDSISREVSLDLTVQYSRTFYAAFAQDAHSVCEWEGSQTPKALVWRSKTYAASKPFNPSACRVDALGYTPQKVLELTVDMFSSPAAAATATAKLVNIANQDARRLPVRRMERFMQVEVKANAEVDALLVGTSMGGLAQ